MRSKEVEEKIHMLKSYAGMTHKQTDNQGRPKLDQAIDIVLSYIYELEKENLTQRSQINSAFDNGFIHKDKIRDKINNMFEIYHERYELDFEEVRQLISEIHREVLEELLGE